MYVITKLIIFSLVKEQEFQYLAMSFQMQLSILKYENIIWTFCQEMGVIQI